MKIGIVDVGGGFRGIYACGVLDYCLDNNIKFDLGIGVSAGSANLASYLSGQRGRNYTFYTEYGMRKQYAGIWNFIKEKSFIGLDYIYSTLSNSDGENPLDYAAMRDNSMDFLVVATDAVTGEAKYFDKSDIRQDSYDVFKASSSIPFICKPYTVNGRPYYDGVVSDPVPVDKAFNMGCDRVVVLLSRPENYKRSSKQDEQYAKLVRRKYPEAAKKMCLRAQRYNESVEKTKEYAKQGRALIVAPDDTCGVGTLSRDKDALISLYEKGYKDGQKIERFIK
ncbi:MAG: patatin family protein [Oscillospiraceae bacterium]|nr:patatin family protein [Oscillospiraceae bacterium]